MAKDHQNQYGDAPVTEEYKQKMIAVMKTLDEFVNEGVRGPTREIAIVVMMFRFGDAPDRCNFMSNGVRREDMVTLFKEMIARFEGQPEIQGHA